MKKLFLSGAACLLLAASCSKDDDNTTVNPQPNPQPTSMNGYFSVKYDTAKVQIDSMRSYYLNPNGGLDSVTTIGKYSWQSAARRYDSGDSAYAMVFAWGRLKSIASGLEEMKFSEDFVASKSSRMQATSRKDNKNGFMASYGFRMK